MGAGNGYLGTEENIYIVALKMGNGNRGRGNRISIMVLGDCGHKTKSCAEGRKTILKKYRAGDRDSHAWDGNEDHIPIVALGIRTGRQVYQRQP